MFIAKFACRRILLDDQHIIINNFCAECIVQYSLHCTAWDTAVQCSAVLLISARMSGWADGIDGRVMSAMTERLLLSRGQTAICIHISVLVFSILQLCWDRGFVYLNLCLCVCVCLYLSFCDFFDCCVLHSKLEFLQANDLTSRETVPLESLSKILNAPSTKKFWREQNESYVVHHA